MSTTAGIQSAAPTAAFTTIADPEEQFNSAAADVAETDEQQDAQQQQDEIDAQKAAEKLEAEHKADHEAEALRHLALASQAAHVNGALHDDPVNTAALSKLQSMLQPALESTASI